MQIFLDHFCLSAGGDETPENLRLNGERTVPASAILTPGERMNTLSFGITREHASYGAAEAFLFSHAATLPGSGALTAICEDAGGAQVRYLAQAAAVRADAGTQRGTTTTHVYTLICGAISGGELALETGGTT